MHPQSKVHKYAVALRREIGFHPGKISSHAMQKPRLSFWQIWNMSFGFLGIQFGWGLQMANMSPIYKYLGAADDQIAKLWLAAPLTGLIVQPIIGAMSDRTWGWLGRRRPYFLVGAILSSLALILMPNSGSLAEWLIPHLPKFYMAAGLLWVLDASINISMEPFRAYVADKLPEEQRGVAVRRDARRPHVGHRLLDRCHARQGRRVGAGHGTGNPAGT